MSNYANQLTIQLQLDNTIRYKDKDTGEYFAPWVYWKYKKAAMKKLTGNGYKLWEYMYSWAGQGYYDLSPTQINNEIGISEKGVRNARKELEMYGCLNLVNGKKNTYIFNPAAIL